MLKFFKGVFVFAILSIFIGCVGANAEPKKDTSHMKFAFMFAMKEESRALEALNIPITWHDYKGYKIANFNYKNHKCVAVIMGVGKSLSAGAAALVLEKYSPDVLINISSAGGLNCKVGDIILSQSALFHDVNLGAINYELYRLPDLPIIIKTKNDLIKEFDIKNKISKDITIRSGIVISSDQFLRRAQYYKELSKHYPDAKATEMEAASIAAICHRAGYDYLFIKKITNVADDDLNNNSFDSEILKFKDKVGQILLAIMNS